MKPQTRRARQPKQPPARAPRSKERRFNEEAVLQAVFHHGPLTRLEISERTDLSIPTVSSIVDDLIGAGLVQAKGRTQGGVGRSAAMYSVDGRVSHVIGVDVGGTKMLAAIADVYGEIRAEFSVATDTSSTEAFLAQLRGTVEEVAQAGQVDRTSIKQVTIGMPGTVDPATGKIRLAYNLPDLSEVDLAQAVGSQWPAVEIQIENDANLAAVGEQWRGLAQDVDTFVAISIGTGLGAGLVIDGKLFRGNTGAAGEIAYLPYGSSDYDLTALPRGPLEEALSGRAVARAVSERMGSADEAVGGEALDLTAVDVFAAAARGDEVAVHVVDEQAKRTAYAIAATVALVAPEMVVLGGGIGANPLLLEPVRKHAARLLSTPTPIHQSALGPRAAMVGALALGVERARAALFTSTASQED